MLLPRRALPPLSGSFTGCGLIQAMGAFSKDVPLSGFDVRCISAGGWILLSQKNCTAVTDVDASPLFSCSSCSSRPCREEEEETRNWSCGSTRRSRR